MKKKLNKLLNTTYKHGLADYEGKRAVISTVTDVDNREIRTWEHTKARVPLTQDEGVDGNATFKHSSWRSAQFVVKHRDYSIIAGISISLTALQFEILPGTSAVPGMKGMRIWAEFREHKHEKIFIRKYKNNYVAQCIQTICRGVIALEILGAVKWKRESILSVVQRRIDRAKEWKSIQMTICCIWAANTQV